MATPIPVNQVALPRRGLARSGALPEVSVLVAAGVLALLVLAAIVPSLFTGSSPTDTDLTSALAAPSGAHWFGTDQLGRDLFTRVVYGTRPALLIGLGATAMGVVAGTIIGVGSALGGRIGDQVVMRLVDILLALPYLITSLLVVTVAGTGALATMVAIALPLAPGFARLVRARALVVRRSGYVEAAVGLGLRRGAVVARHIVPNALGELLVLATVGFGSAIISVSTLSFLGFGAKPVNPDWGSLLNDGRDFLSTAWWLGVFPGVAVIVTVIAVNVVGRHFQARLLGRSPL